SYDAYGNPTQLSADWSTIQVISEDGYLFHGQKWSMEQGQYLSAEGFWDPEIGRGLVPANGSNADAEETAETLGNGYIFAAYFGAYSVTNDPAMAALFEEEGAGSPPVYALKEEDEASCRDADFDAHFPIAQ